MSQVPGDMSDRPGPAAPQVERLVRAACRRERIADAAALLTRVALPLGCVLAAAGVLATRRLDAPAWLGWLGLVPVVLVLVYAVVRPARPRRAARKIDAHYGLHDLIGNAFEIAGRPLPAGDVQAADLLALHVADAEAAAPALDPRPVVPLRPPGLRPHDFAAAALLVLAMLVPRPPPPVVDEPAPPDMPEESAKAAAKKAPTDRALTEPLREDLRALKEGEDRAAALAERMLQILDAYGRGELDREAAYAQLEELEKSLADAEADLEARMEEDPAVLAEGVRQLAEALKQEEITQDAAEALARGDGDEAEKSLADAEAAAEASDEAEKSLQRAMQQAEKSLGKAAGENTDTASQLAEAERRLKRQQEQPAADPQEQERRLKKQQQKVDELRRQHEREKAAQRKLDELRRQANDAQKGQKGSQQKKRALEELRRGASDAARKASQSRRLGQARDDLEEAKSFMRRAGQGGEQDDKRKQQMQKFAKAAKGKKPGQKDGPTLLVEGDLGDGEPSMQMEGDSGGDPQDSGDGGDPQDSGDGDGDGQDSGQGQDSSGDGQAQGDGMGQGAADALGDPTGLKVKPKDVRVDPKQGKGTTKAEIIKTASQEGFASAPYRNMYTDYKAFAQSTLDSEALPAEQRRRVKRYFQMIQPRK
ncbi:hypothetical protein [Nannocystis sp. SCPEA4]|uniref:hypothetical protein n=1 Tax=Nannocystis sp. SCPEA4 TaxID=2996787 RepID=UPI00226D6E67|nr:hypothetical protein [Nannocystis sp. SCPEA4]MCY1058837.1 hypothetical protein [Nannocystis sp. SCPEA4]